MLCIPFDIVNEVISHLNRNIDIVNFLSTKKEYHTSKHKAKFLPFLCLSKKAKLIYKSLPYKSQITHKKYIVRKNCTVSIPKGTTEVKFGENFDIKLTQTLKPGDIPDTVVKIVFRTFLINIIDPGVIPYGVQYLDLGACHNLKKGSIPDTVRYLTFGYTFDRVIDIGVIPNSVVSLEILSYCHEFTPGIIPNSVVTLRFSKDYSGPLNRENIPDSVKLIITNKDHFENIDPEIKWSTNIITYD